MGLKLAFAESTAKVLPADFPKKSADGGAALRGERAYFQIVYRLENCEYNQKDYKLSVKSDLPFSLSRVGLVAADYPAYPDADGDYITKTPALLPDVLYPLEGDSVSALKDYSRALWVSLPVGGDAAAGAHEVKFSFDGGDDRAEAVFTLNVVDAALPEQELVYTQWFHADCIATRYGVPVFSEEHWALIEKYMRCAAEHGQNMILTPVLTPALDTAVGTERPTVQLADVTYRGGKYAFGFEKLDRWIDTAHRAGMKYFEISHLFTQWGAVAAPKVMADTDEGYRRIFGWETDAGSPEYTRFVTELLIALRGRLEARGVFENCRFHVSDEPDPAYFDRYLARAEVIRRVIPEAMITDALSHYDFYEKGALTRPIPATNAITPFLEHRVPELWCYYCCGQGRDVSNRFIAMPGRRTRIIGLQFYKYDIKGFLQWGYNFWYGHLSLTRIDPFATTSGDGVFPSGDPFSVYPGPDGPLCSVRQLLFEQALYDLRAARLLESRIGRARTLALIEEGAAALTFDDYPRTDGYLTAARGRINAAIAGSGEEK